MSKIRVQSPIIHTPSFKEFVISNEVLARLYLDKGIKIPFPISDSFYYYTDREGWISLISHLLVKSNLYKTDKFDCAIPAELAFAFGLFFAEGYCAIRNKDTPGSGANWKITNTNPELLERCIAPLEREWVDLTFQIKQYPSEAKGKMTNLGVRRNGLHNLEVKVKERHNDSKRSLFIQDFRSMFYTEAGHKKVPGCVLESPLIVKQAFIEGAIEGDAYKAQHRLWIDGDAGKWGVVLLLNDLGMNPSIVERRNDCFAIHYTYRRQYDAFVLEYLESIPQDYVSVQKLSDKFCFSNPHMAGIIERLEKEGNIISEKPWSQRKNIKFLKGRVPHCEDFAIKAMVTCAELYGLNTLRYTYGLTQWGAHGFNTCWTGDGFLVFEPNEGFNTVLDSPLFDWGLNRYEPSYTLL